MTPVKFYLIRHTEPQWVQNGEPVNDAPLSPLGERQAEALSTALNQTDVVFNHSWASPMVRAYQTATYLWDRIFTVKGWAKELQAPKRWETGTMDEVNAEIAAFRSRNLSDMWDGFWRFDDGRHDGEKLRSLKSRVIRGIKGELKDLGLWAPHPRHAGQFVWSAREPLPETTIGLVGHKMANAYLLSFLLGKPSSGAEWYVWAADFASITELELMPLSDGFIWRLKRFNDTSHLRAADIPLSSAASHGA